ncbi:MAG: type II and III secretion system protein family protein [Sulfuricella sp.]|nr:type II and III secretion system protein family protein [Sulfuricella sp.]
MSATGDIKRGADEHDRIGVGASAFRVFLGSWSAAILALAFLLPSAAAAEDTLLEVSAGGQRLLKLEKPARRVAVGNSEVAEAKVLNSQELLLQGNKPGETSLMLWTKGSAQPRSFRLQVNKAAGASPWLASDGLSLKSSGELLILEGAASDMQEHERAREIAQHAGGDGKSPLLDAAKMSFGGQVQVDVRVVEFSRKVLKKAGLNLISNTSGFTFGTFAPSSLTKVTLENGAISTEANLPVSQAFNLLTGFASSGVLGVLGVLENNGFARTLAQPVLVAQSGQSADFLAGGEFPVPVPQSLGQTTIQYKPFGIRLEVSPTVLSANRIALRVAPEVSDLNFENAITINGISVPSLLTRRATTSIELGNGESFVIGGLVSQSVLKNVGKIPGLGDIPVLGMFFKSVSLSREDKELVFIVTPRLVNPLAAGTELGPMPGADKANYNPSLWSMLMLSDDNEVARFTGLSQ